MGLEATGFRWIDVVYGLGLNASNCGQGAAAASDAVWMQAANPTWTKLLGAHSSYGLPD